MGIFRIIVSIGVVWGFMEEGCLSLKITKLRIPDAVKKGETAVLECHYDLEGGMLYSVKWYKGTFEFFRYTPLDRPQTKQFHLRDLNVNVNMTVSNGTYLVLDDVSFDTGGVYSCEVSMDAPTFDTNLESGQLKVVELPLSDPHIKGLRTRYHKGDVLKAVCTSEKSRPAANLTWFRDEKPTEPQYLSRLKIEQDHEGYYTSHLRIQFVIQPNESEGKRKIKLRCNADIYKIYQRTVGKTVDIEMRKHKGIHKTTTTTTTLLPEIEETDYDDDDEYRNREDLSSVWNFISNFGASDGVKMKSFHFLIFLGISLVVTR